MKVQKFYGQSSDHIDHSDESELRGNPVFDLRTERDDSSVEDDDESAAVMKYLSAVSNESKAGPTAVVASLSPSKGRFEKPSVAFAGMSFSQTRRNYFELLLDDVTLGLKMDAFRATRCQVQSGNFPVQKQRKLDFESENVGMHTLQCLDESSIVSAVERLVLYLTKLSRPEIYEWLFALLVFLPTPLLEDTADALQKLRKFCECDQQSEIATLLAAVISLEFGQK